MGLIQDTEAKIKRTGAAYVAVDEAKKALFAGAKLSSFHFVVYRAAGPNWLVCCGERTVANLRLMREWVAIFGDGFRPFFSRRRKGGAAFCDFDGVAVELEAAGEATPAQPELPEVAVVDLVAGDVVVVEVVGTSQPFETRTANCFRNVQDANARQLSLFGGVAC